MSEMMIYIVSALFCISFCSFASFSGETERWVRVALGSILLLALLKPVVSTVSDINLSDISFGDGVEYGNSVAHDTLKEAYSEGIEIALCAEFPISRDDVSVFCDGFSEKTVSATLIRVELSGDGIGADARGIREYVEKNFGECEVELNFE